MDGIDTSGDSTTANVLWISTGIIGCALNALLLLVLLIHSKKGFYRTLTITLALVDFSCAFTGIFQATWYYQVGKIEYCVDYGISNFFADWLVQVIWIAWVATFYAELTVITYSFIWRAVLISNARWVTIIESKFAIVPITLIVVGITYCDYANECGVEYVDLDILTTLEILLPAILSGAHFLIIIVSAVYIQCKIRSGTFSKNMRATHKKRLFILITQAVNPFFFNFLVDVVYLAALLAPMPPFLVELIPISSVHPALHALTLLVMTNEHRHFILNRFFCKSDVSATSSLITTNHSGANVARI